MARQDITVDTEYGEVETSDNIADKSFYDFRLLDAVVGAGNDASRYGEIVAPVGFVYTYNGGKGFHVRIPYTSNICRLTARLVMEGGSGGVEYPRSPVMGKHWFSAVTETEAGATGIALAAFSSLSRRGVYNLLSRDGYLAVHNGSETDFEIGTAKAQNETFLLKTSVGSLYQHSTTDIGLADYLYSSLENSGFAVKLQSEFLPDKVVIKSAYMDSATGELLLETEEKEENDG